MSATMQVRMHCGCIVRQVQAGRLSRVGFHLRGIWRAAMQML